MIQREMRLVITFHTTSEAMAMEQICRMRNADGRLIPVPRSITAGCGLAWSAHPESREALEKLMQAENISFQEMHECLV